MTSKPTSAATPTWRCESCGAVLGRLLGDVVEVRLKGAAYEIVGSVRARCRRCGARSELAPARAG